MEAIIYYLRLVRIRGERNCLSSEKHIPLKIENVILQLSYVHFNLNNFSMLTWILMIGSKIESNPFFD